MQTWVPINPCDHEIHRPYYIGDLQIAAATCTRACPTTTYPDNAQVCHPCPVVGCATCSRDGCQDCLIFHLKVHDRCIFLFGALFAAVILFVLCFLLCGILRFGCFALLSPRNPNVLKEALIHRRRAKVHDYSLPGNPFYSYDDTNVQRQSISGVGPMLYFRFVAYLVLLSFLMVVGLTIRYFLPQMVSSNDDMKFATLVLSASLYLLCLIATIRFMWTQGRVVKQDVEEEPHLRNYALVAEGFPKSARSPHEVKAFFESILGFEIEGVSIAYDHIEEIEFVEDRVQRVVEKADCHLGVYPAELSGLEGHVGDSQDGYVLDCLMDSGYAFIVFSREEDREFCLRRFAEIDKQHRQGPVTGGEDSDDDEAVLLPGKGRKAGGPSRAVLFRGKFPIRVGHAPEPSGIQWRNFTVQPGAKVVRVMVTFLVCLLLVLVVSAVMFAPAVLYEMSYIDIAKPQRYQYEMAVMEQTLVCTSIAVVNRALMKGLSRAVELSGFLQRVNEDCIFASCGFWVVFLNSTASVIIAWIVAYSERTSVTRDLAVQVIFQAYWMCMVVAETAKWLGPSWAYWAAYFKIRQSKYMSVRESEPLMTSWEFNIATRYVDNLHLLTLLFTMVALKSSSLYTVGAHCLHLVYTIYLYFMDKYLFLRLSRQTYYTSPKLDQTVHYILGFPFAVLFVWPLGHFVVNLPYANVFIFLANIAVYLIIARLCQKFNEPTRELTDVPYVEVASLVPYNYFNTNPVHVMRTLHFPSIVVPPIYPYLSGKEYLQGGQFADYDDSVRLRETLMLLVKNPLKGIDDFGNPQDLG